jgi:hypothetical protein
MRYWYRKVFLLLIIGNTAFTQTVTLDWKMHNVGSVRQVVTNMGTIWRAETTYPGLLYCEYPLNSNEEHIGAGGIWIGAISNGDTLVSSADRYREFYPSGAADDTIWVVSKGDTVDIPYWSGYTGVSDQDFICRYSDYNKLNIANHYPLYLDVIQTSYAWSSSPLDEMIVYTFYIIPTKNDLENVYICYWLDGNVGYRSAGWDFALDDQSHYIPEMNMALAVDPPGGVDEEAISPLGIKVYPPEELDPASIDWTFQWYGAGEGPPGPNAELYQVISSGEIESDQQTNNGSEFILAFGILNLAVGDTAKFIVGEIVGNGLDGVKKNAAQLDWLVDQKFKVPSPPPIPPLRVETQSHRIVLEWDSVKAGDVNPETYKDPNRADSAEVPFEGYRVYKSAKSQTGPWTLLGEYDLDNDFGLDTGLEHEYLDIGLLNNLEYYYAVTAFSKPDSVSNFPSQESSKNAGAQTVVPGTAPPKTVGNAAVVPNPYRGDIAYHAFNPAWERVPSGRNWMEQDRRIQFINLPAQCEIKVYSLAGNLIITIEHNNAQRGYEDWNLTSSAGQAIASGIYLFTVEDSNNGEVQTGKFVVIK